MRRLLKRRWLGIPVGIIAASLVSVAVLAVALLGYVVPSTVTIQEEAGPIEPDTWAIMAYADEACTEPLESLAWGGVVKGTPATQTVYIQNLSGDPTITIVVTSDLDEAVGTLVGVVGNEVLVDGDSTDCLLTLTANADAVADVEAAFNISFTATK